jgi:hypothetical protein
VRESQGDFFAHGLQLRGKKHRTMIETTIGLFSTQVGRPVRPPSPYPFFDAWGGDFGGYYEDLPLLEEEVY